MNSFVVDATNYPWNSAYAHLSAGVCCGMSSVVRNGREIII